MAAGALTFEAVRTDRFPAFALGVEAGRAGGTAPAVFNAANEVAVAEFLAGRAPFGGIARAIADALARWPGGPVRVLDDVRQADAWARRAAHESLSRLAPC